MFCPKRFLVRSAEESTQRLAERLSSCQLDAFGRAFDHECTSLCRFLWNHCTRLEYAFETARVEPKEGKAQSSLLALSLSASERALALLGRYSETLLAQRLDKLLAQGQLTQHTAIQALLSKAATSVTSSQCASDCPRYVCVRRAR